MIKHSLFALALVIVAASSASAQNPQPAGRGGGRGGRRSIEVMKLSTSAWQDGGAIPPKFAQPGASDLGSQKLNTDLYTAGLSVRGFLFF